jgi:hypothetical protein
MPGKIEPALSSQEWAEPYPVVRDDVTMQVKMRGDGTCRIYIEKFSSPVDEERSLHAIAALALHGQEYGFTREDVAQVKQHGFDSLANRIAALLPPGQPRENRALRPNVGHLIRAFGRFGVAAPGLFRIQFAPPTTSAEE